jgi:hypothetical protein
VGDGRSEWLQHGWIGERLQDRGSGQSRSHGDRFCGAGGEGVRAGLDYGQASGYSPTSAVTFHACAAADTAFIGGFHVVGRRCVPFDVREDHKASIRIVISFFNGPCNQA